MNLHSQGILDRLQESLADEYDGFAQVAAGGMGIVFKAEHRLLQRVDAIKVLFFTGEEADRERRRFYDEARIIAGLSHPNIRQVYGARYDTDRDLSYLLMAFVDGENLKERLRRELPSIQGGLSIAREVTQALQYAHSKRVIHRDIKPANILIDGEGHAYLADFGIALDPDVTQSNTVPGTLQYMAPELLQGSGPSAVTDIYALGHVLSEILTGRRHNGDFVEESDPGRGLHHYKARVDDDEAAGMLHDLVDRMTSRTPESRPRLCGEVLGRLDQVRRTLKPNRTSLAKVMRKLPNDGGDPAMNEDSEPRITVTALDSSSSDVRHAPVLPEMDATADPQDPEGAGDAAGSEPTRRGMEDTVVLGGATVRKPLKTGIAGRRNARAGSWPGKLWLSIGLVVALSVATVTVSRMRSHAKESDVGSVAAAETPADTMDVSVGMPAITSHVQPSGPADSGDDGEVLEAEPVDPTPAEQAPPTRKAPITSPAGTSSGAERQSTGICVTRLRLIMNLESEHLRMPLLRVWKKGESVPRPTDFRGLVSVEGRPGDIFVVELLRRGLTIEPPRQEIVLDPRRTDLELRFDVRPEAVSGALLPEPKVTMPRPTTELATSPFLPTSPVALWRPVSPGRVAQLLTRSKDVHDDV